MVCHGLIKNMNDVCGFFLAFSLHLESQPLSSLVPHETPYRALTMRTRVRDLSCCSPRGERARGTVRILEYTTTSVWCMLRCGRHAGGGRGSRQGGGLWLLYSLSLEIAQKEKERNDVWNPMCDP